MSRTTISVLTLLILLLSLLLDIFLPLLFCLGNVRVKDFTLPLIRYNLVLSYYRRR